MKRWFRYSVLTMAPLSLILLFTSFTDKYEEVRTVNTPGVVTFKVTTLPAGGTYSPRHVFAIWIEKDGIFVKTRKAMANARKQYLYKWAASSNYNVTDAITGATLTSHQTHTVQWNCTNVSGNVVPDGIYTLWVEFTDKHAQGPFYSIQFNKGTEPVLITPPNQTYLTNMELSYAPAIVPGDANCDGAVNVLDVVGIVAYILGSNPQPFCFNNADVNADSIVNILDVVGTVNIIMG